MTLIYVICTFKNALSQIYAYLIEDQFIEISHMAIISVHLHFIYLSSLNIIHTLTSWPFKLVLHNFKILAYIALDIYGKKAYNSKKYIDILKAIYNEIDVFFVGSILIS